MASSCYYTSATGTLMQYPDPSYTGPKYTGAMVQSKNQFTQYGGSFEARVYIPAAAASNARAGGWTAWWMNGTDAADWPQHGEIDLIEGLGGDTAAHTHYNDSGNPSAPHDPAPGANSVDAYVGWHNIGASWNTSTQKVTFYWDGVSAWSGSAAAGTVSLTSTLPQYLLFDNTISDQGLAPKSFPSTMLVDWVRVWK